MSTNLDQYGHDSQARITAQLGEFFDSLNLDRPEQFDAIRDEVLAVTSDLGHLTDAELDAILARHDDTTAF